MAYNKEYDRNYRLRNAERISLYYTQYYEAHKDDPEFKEKNRLRAARNRKRRNDAAPIGQHNIGL